MGPVRDKLSIHAAKKNKYTYLFFNLDFDVSASPELTDEVHGNLFLLLFNADRQQFFVASIGGQVQL